MSSTSIAKRMRVDPQVGDNFLYFNKYTQRNHEMVVVDVIKPAAVKKLFPYQDKRKTCVVMLYIEDPTNTKMYFYKGDLQSESFTPADIKWNPI